MKKGRFGTHIGLTLLLLASLLFSFAAVANAQTTIYIDDSNKTGVEDGTQEHPYDTIGEALAVAEYGDVIFIEKGWYREDINLVDGVSLQGESAKNTRVVGNIDGESVGDLFVKDLKIIGNVLITFDAESGSLEPVELAYNIIEGRISASTFARVSIHDNDISGRINISHHSPIFPIKNNKIHDGEGIIGGTDGRADIVDNEVYRTTRGIFIQELYFGATFKGNHIHHNGAGIEFEGSGGPDHFIIIGNRIHSNEKGGIISSGNEKIDAINNLIQNNKGPGINLTANIFSGNIVNIINNTILGNTGGVVKTGTYEAVTVANSILWGNGDELVNVAATYSDIEDGDAGEGNISENPRINRRTGMPTPNSPVIDAGSNALVPAGITTGLCGNQRILDGDGDSNAIVDMGACEKLFPKPRRPDHS